MAVTAVTAVTPDGDGMPSAAKLNPTQRVQWAAQVAVTAVTADTVNGRLKWAHLACAGCRRALQRPAARAAASPRRAAPRPAVGRKESPQDAAFAPRAQKPRLAARGAASAAAPAAAAVAAAVAAECRECFRRRSWGEARVVREQPVGVERGRGEGGTKGCYSMPSPVDV